MTELQKKIVEGLNATFGTIADKVISSIETDRVKKSKNDDDGDDSERTNVTINVDEEILAKHLADQMKPEVKKDDEDDDSDDEYIDEYDEMNKNELSKECNTREIKVFSGTSVELMKKKLRKYDEDDTGSAGSNNNDDDDKTINSNLEKAQKKIKETIKSITSELGVDEKDFAVEFEIKSRKKSIVNDDDEDEGKFDDSGIDLTDESAVMKAYDLLNDEEKQELLGDFIGTKYLGIKSS